MYLCADAISYLYTFFIVLERVHTTGGVYYEHNLDKISLFLHICMILDYMLK